MKHVRGRKGRVLFFFCLIPGAVVWLSLIGLMNGQWTRLDQRRFPWAYTESGRATLTGVWVGTLTTNRGAKRGLLLDVRFLPLRFGHQGGKKGGLRFFHLRANDNLTGELRVCGGPKGEQRFTLQGNITTDDASRFQLKLSAADSVPIDGLALSAIRGSWDGRDSLGVDADLYVSYRGELVINPRDSETNTPQPGALRRAEPAAFAAQCERLWA